MYKATYQSNTHCIELSKDGMPWFSIPAAVTVNNTVYAPALQSDDGSILRFADDTAELIFTLRDDAIEVDFSLSVQDALPIHEVYCFKDAAGGLRIAGFDRAFTPQPRRNQGHNMDFYKNLPDCSMNGYFYPPITNFSIGNTQGWVSFGLLDLPDSYRYRLCEDHSILTESCGGNKVIPAGGTYRMPKMLITFPADEWDGIALFRRKLEAYGRFTPSKKPLSELPAWWRDPLVCTYGDELSTLLLDDVDMIDPRFNADWVRMLVDTAEKDWGIRHMNIVLDAFWQLHFALDPQVDTARFGNMRDFTDEMHRRGHHVIAWITPTFDNTANGFTTRSQKLDVLSNTAIDPLGVPGSYIIDMTSDNISEYYKQVCQVLFGDGDGEYNFDGVKLDYVALLRDPAIHGSYRHPERGLGIREMKLFLEVFYEAVKSVKPDALVNFSSTDPRFEHLFDMNRLHDTHAGTIEKELRARVASTACPDLLIDSDGALMLTDWAKHHYIGAAIYSTPSNYYTLTYHDRKLNDRDVHPMGTLLGLSSHRPDGHPVMDDFGSWRLVEDDGTVNAMSIGGHTVVYYPWKKSKTGYLFTWRNETVILPLCGRKFGRLSEPVEGYQVDYARDRVIIRLQPGKLYTFESIDEGNCISALFAGKTAAEEAVEYSNG